MFFVIILVFIIVCTSPYHISTGCILSLFFVAVHPACFYKTLLFRQLSLSALCWPTSLGLPESHTILSPFLPYGTSLFVFGTALSRPFPGSGILSFFNSPDRSFFGSPLRRSCPWYLYSEIPTMNLEKIYTSLYRSFNFQKLLWHFLAQRIFYELSFVKVYVYTTVCSDATALSKLLRATEGQLQMFSLLTEVDWINVNN